MVIENAFGRLKGRWRCLLNQMDFKLENVPAVVATCVVLHNMCEMYGDNFCDEWASPQSAQSTDSRATTARNDSRSAMIRNAIKDYLKKETV